MPEVVPLSIAGRSPFDGIRLRWGAGGTVFLGVAALFQATAVGVIFGLILITLGVATWWMTQFGAISWLDLSQEARWVSGTSSVIGNLFLLIFFGVAILIFWAIRVASRH